MYKEKSIADIASVQKFLNSAHSFKGLEKLNVFYNNKTKNKPLRWWLQEMDSSEASDEPFNTSKFMSTYKIFSQKKLTAAQYLNEVLDWAINNRSKFQNGLKGKMIQFRPQITKNEDLEKLKEEEDKISEKKSFKTIANFLKSGARSLSSAQKKIIEAEVKKTFPHINIYLELV